MTDMDIDTTLNVRRSFSRPFPRPPHTPVTPDYSHPSYARIPIARRELLLENPEDHVQLIQMGLRKNMNVEQYMRWCGTSSGWHERVSAKPLCYWMTDMNGKHTWTIWGRESLHDSANLRAFDFLWNHLDRAEEIGWDVEARSGSSENDLMKMYVKMHELVCGLECKDSEWHPLESEVLSFHGNLGVNENTDPNAFFKVNLEHITLRPDPEDEEQEEQEEQNDDDHNNPMLRLQIPTPSPIQPLSQEFLASPACSPYGSFYSHIQPSLMLTPPNANFGISLHDMRDR
jgi:hypothetical protein